MDFYAKKSARCNRVLFVTELAVSGTQCSANKRKPSVRSLHLEATSFYNYVVFANRLAVMWRSYCILTHNTVTCHKIHVLHLCIGAEIVYI